MKLIGPLATGLLMSLIVSSCTVNPPKRENDEPTISQLANDLDIFTVLSYNVWHGLDTGEFWVTSTESPEQNEARLRFQVTQLARETPDVIFLQEVNPLPQKASDYVAALRELGLDYTEVHQVDACGIRLNQKRALVPGLNNGLAILAKKELQLRKITGLKLSGDLGNCQSTAGIQLEELRYGLIAEITLPDSAKYLVASVHLHSGFEAGSSFLMKLDNLYEQGRFKRYPWLMWEIEKARLRRIGELDTLMRELNKLNRDGAYAGLAIGGDFNFEWDFPEFEEATLLRLSDTNSLAYHKGEHNTADPTRNGLINHRAELKIPPLLEKETADLSHETKKEILSAYLAEMNRPRRIDYIFVNSFFPDYCLRQELFGLDVNTEGLPASDHFGVLNTYTRDTTLCRTPLISEK